MREIHACAGGAIAPLRDFLPRATLCEIFPWLSLGASDRPRSGLEVEPFGPSHGFEHRLGLVDGFLELAFRCRVTHPTPAGLHVGFSVLELSAKLCIEFVYSEHLTRTATEVMWRFRI